MAARAALLGHLALEKTARAVLLSHLAPQDSIFEDSQDYILRGGQKFQPFFMNGVDMKDFKFPNSWYSSKGSSVLKRK